MEKLSHLNKVTQYISELVFKHEQAFYFTTAYYIISK